MSKPGSRAGAAGEFDPQRLPLSRELQAQFAKYGATAVRPAYPYPFAHPALAADLGLDRVYVVELPQGTDTPGMARALRAVGGEIEQAGTDLLGELAEFIPDDPEFAMQYGLHNTGQLICTPGCVAGTPGADIRAPAAWSLHTGETGGVVIAFLDSGLFPHQEFDGRVLLGINIIEPDNPIGTLDTIGHGTHVTGIATARGNNGAGIAGVHWGAQILPVRVTTASGATSGLHVGNGLIWAADHSADVINMSLQFYTFTDTADNLVYLEDAVAYAHALGVVLVAAAGNGPRSACSTAGNLCVTSAQCPPGETCDPVVAYPARYDQVIAVGGTDNLDQRLSISNRGPEVELAAPGHGVWSLGLFGANLFQSGTSMSAAFVSGAAALLKTYRPDLTSEDIRGILVATADDLGPPGRDPEFGFGRLNLHNALRSVTDSDGDGISDLDDNCPLDFNSDQLDTDADGAGDVCDECADDPFKTNPGVCGCFVPESDLDSDADGTPDCVDECPFDPLKTKPLICGCNRPDSDSDGDGAPDCLDECPDDPLKTQPGLCGCGLSDAGDEDTDGVPDCVDACPGVDDALFAPQCAEAIPTVSQWGLVTLALLLLTAAKLRFGRIMRVGHGE